jgi:hypothetical protein
LSRGVATTELPLSSPSCKNTPQIFRTSYELYLNTTKILNPSTVLLKLGGTVLNFFKQLSEIIWIMKVHPSMDNKRSTVIYPSHMCLVTVDLTSNRYKAHSVLSYTC